MGRFALDGRRSSDVRADGSVGTDGDGDGDGSDGARVRKALDRDRGHGA
jgi:hypothetical protein